MCNVTYHQGNVNQNYYMIPVHIHQDGYFKITENNKFGKDVEKLEGLCTVSVNVKLYSHSGKQNGGSSKKKIQHMIYQFHNWVYTQKNSKQGLNNIFVHQCSQQYSLNKEKVGTTKYLLRDECGFKIRGIYIQENIQP